MKKILSILFILCCSLSATWAQQPDNLMKLWYDKPAADWNAALPLGNGRLGVMVFGVPTVEQLQLNEETIWAGSPNSNAHPLEEGVLDKVRQLVFDGKYLEAQDLATAKIMSPKNHGMPYQTMGDMFISFPGHANYTDYYRELDLMTATTVTRYKVNGVTYHREVFTSFTDQAIIVRLTADKSASITCNVSMTTPQEKVQRTSTSEQLVLSGLTPAHEKQSGKVQFETRVKPKVKGGKFLIKDDVIAVENADEVILYVAIATNFVDYASLRGDKTAKCLAYLNKAYANDYQKAKEEHIAFYQEQLNRVSLDLGVTEAAKQPTDVRIKNFAQSDDPQLVALYFQFGRYLLISCSQPGTQPANLQGIWNDRYLPSWDSKYTCNINLQMNYWPAEVANLSELHEPMIQLIRDVAETGAHTAQLMYGTRGWVLHHNTDIWRITAPVDRAPSGMWPVGGAWVCQHLWERYLHTGDKDFLLSAYPVMKQAALFFVDFMIECPYSGYQVVVPSNSPENTHAGSNGKATTASGCTVDNQLVFDLYSNIIQASEILSHDRSFADSLKILRERISPMRIGQHHQLQEWQIDWDDPEDKHRHVSHLYGVFPSNQISPYRTPELFDAARTSLIYRGDPSTGWSMGWKVCLWARFLDGNHAHKLLTEQLSLVTNELKKGGTYTNMFDAHPPFQIDGNFGCAAGIAEMIMQSYDGFIYLLPAIPDHWKDGSVKGLVARGGFEIDMTWKNGKVSELTIHSKIGGNCRIRSQSSLRGSGLKTAKGKNPNHLFSTPEIKQPIISEKAKLNPVNLATSYLYDLKTEAGKTYHFKFKN